MNTAHATVADMLDPRRLAELQGFRLRARRIVEGLVAGLHRSPWRGFSVEFAEHREYTPGEDIRHLDWRLLARTDKFYVKTYEDETNLVVHLVLDASASMRYRGPTAALSKFEYARCLTAGLAWIALRQQDAVGLTTFDAQPHVWLPPSGSAARWNDLLTVLDSVRPEQTTHLGRVLEMLAATLPKRGVVLIVSDLLCDPETLLSGLRRLQQRRHELALIQVLDDAELDFPFSRPTLFRGLEGAERLRADPNAVRRAYLAELHQHQQRLRRACLEFGIRFRLARTSEPFDRALRDFLARK